MFNIKEMLKDDSRISYTTKETQDFLNKAKQLKIPISMDYAEEWKVLNEDMGRFMPLLLILILLVILPLFGNEPQVKMKELY